MSVEEVLPTDEENGFDNSATEEDAERASHGPSEHAAPKKRAAKSKGAGKSKGAEVKPKEKAKAKARNKLLSLGSWVNHYTGVTGTDESSEKGSESEFANGVPCKKMRGGPWVFVPGQDWFGVVAAGSHQHANREHE